MVEPTCQCRDVRRCWFHPWVGTQSPLKKRNPSSIFPWRSMRWRPPRMGSPVGTAKSWMSEVTCYHWKTVAVVLLIPSLIIPLSTNPVSWLTVLCGWHWTGHWGNALQWNTFSLSPGLYSLVSGGLGREWRETGRIDSTRVCEVLELYLHTLNLNWRSGKIRSLLQQVKKFDFTQKRQAIKAFKQEVGLIRFAL